MTAVWRNRCILLAWAIANIIGSAIVALPDSGSPLIRISATHGPSSSDLFGVAFLVLGAGLQWTYLGLNVSRVIRQTPKRELFIALAIGSGGAFLTAWSVLSDSGYWWALGIAAITGVFLWFVSKTERLQK